MPCALLHHVTHRFGGGPEFAIETQIAMVHLFRRWTSRGAARCIQEQGPTIAETSLVAPAFYLGCIACRAFSGPSDALGADHRHPCKSLSTEKHESSFRALESALLVRSGVAVARVASRRLVPALSRTGHPFAASGSAEPSQKIEFVFSASPETIRREPRESPPSPGR